MGSSQTMAFGGPNASSYILRVISNLFQSAPIRPDRPDLVPAATVGIKRNAAAVRRPARDAVSVCIVRQLTFARAVRVHNIDVFLLYPGRVRHKAPIRRRIGTFYLRTLEEKS